MSWFGHHQCVPGRSLLGFEMFAQPCLPMPSLFGMPYCRPVEVEEVEEVELEEVRSNLPGIVAVEALPGLPPLPDFQPACVCHLLPVA